MEFLENLGNEVIAIIVAVVVAVITPLVVRWRRKAKNKIKRW